MAVTRTSVATQVSDALRARLAAAEDGWQHGDRIPPEAELSAQFGVGRSSVREAIRVLANEGWLEVRQGSGTFVRRGPESHRPLMNRLKRARVIEVFEARHGLEVEASRLAALRRTDDDLELIHRCLARRQDNERRGRQQAFIDADIDFHVAVVAAAHNQVMVDLFDLLAGSLRESLQLLSTHDILSEEAGSAHAELAKAIRAGDPDEAAAAARRQFSTTEAVLRSTTPA